MGGKPRYGCQFSGKLDTRRSIIRWDIPTLTDQQVMQLVVFINRLMVNEPSTITWRQKGRRCSCGCYVWTVKAGKIVCDSCGKVQRDE